MKSAGINKVPGPTYLGDQVGCNDVHGLAWFEVLVQEGEDAAVWEETEVAVVGD
ncbi:hypothetical protein AG1IA_02540 [Rhizoctonia solani AG-1 IA]|uniref:Uncharacterized protein n=1 Tax=Thanatephorus cucumeris (strain AG1-IA) TaxID=983506 RepID=L8X339_THACA|nr:hypothetical protein AG1IA_02540 [Rhizoctonia solani AG-1 IA]